MATLPEFIYAYAALQMAYSPYRRLVEPRGDLVYSCQVKSFEILTDTVAASYMAMQEMSRLCKHWKGVSYV